MERACACVRRPVVSRDSCEKYSTAEQRAGRADSRERRRKKERETATATAAGPTPTQTMANLTSKWGSRESIKNGARQRPSRQTHALSTAPTHTLPTVNRLSTVGGDRKYVMCADAAASRLCGWLLSAGSSEGGGVRHVVPRLQGDLRLSCRFSNANSSSVSA